MEQYYTPAIEDIRIGYECEFHSMSQGGLYITDSKNDAFTKVKEPNNKVWSPIKCGLDLWTERKPNEILDLLANNQIRTPYLTKEQIEAEGWVEQNVPNFIMVIGYEFNRIPFSKGSYRLDYNYELQILAISKFNVIRYYGKCPSINELRVICKLLDIK